MECTLRFAFALLIFTLLGDPLSSDVQA